MPNQKSIWNKIAEPWKNFRDVPRTEVSEFLETKSGKILDLACGSGRNFLEMKGKGEIYAVDFSEEMVGLAKQLAEQINIKAIIKIADVSEMPFEDNFFDAAIYISALHCVDSEDKRKKSLEELFRVLKPNSQALITVWSRNHQRIKNKPKEALIPWTVNNERLERYYYIYDKDELSELLKSVGFKIVSIKEDNNIILIVEKPRLQK